MLKIIRDNPKAFLLALAIHLLLAVFLSLSLDWAPRHKLTSPNVDVIQAVMIDESKIRAEEERQRRLEEETRRKQFEIEKRRKEEAARKQREAEQRKQAELKRQQEAERKRQAEAEAKRKAAEEAERKRKLEAQRQAEALRKQREIEAKRRAEEERKRKEEAERQRQLEEERKRKAEEERIRQEQIAAEQAAMEAARQRALLSERDKYLALIQRRVEEKWVRPTSWPAGTACTVTVRLVPGSGGTAQVIDARLARSCGNPLFDRSVENAVFSASPLPFPKSPELMNEFRELTFNFRPEE